MYEGEVAEEFYTCGLAPKGKGELIKPNKTVFDGIFDDFREFEGDVIFTANDDTQQTIQKGKFEEVSLRECGIIKMSGGEYRGQTFKNRMHGRGRYEYADGAVYDGQYNQDFKEGAGTYTSPEGSVYEGEWYNDLKHGFGKEKDEKDTEYVGSFVNGKYYGSGRWKNKNGDSYRGKFKEGLKDGRGLLIFADGRKIVGPFERDQPSGLCYEEGPKDE